MHSASPSSSIQRARNSDLHIALNGRFSCSQVAEKALRSGSATASARSESTVLGSSDGMGGHPLRHHVPDSSIQMAMALRHAARDLGEESVSPTVGVGVFPAPSGEAPKAQVFLTTESLFFVPTSICSLPSERSFRSGPAPSFSGTERSFCSAQSGTAWQPECQ